MRRQNVGERCGQDRLQLLVRRLALAQPGRSEIVGPDLSQASLPDVIRRHGGHHQPPGDGGDEGGTAVDVGNCADGDGADDATTGNSVMRGASADASTRVRSTCR
jgi:hypothetical protein